MFSCIKDRLGRCAQQCQDKIQDNVDPTTTQSELTKYQAELDMCVDQCCKTHLELIPKMFERINKVLSQVQDPSPRWHWWNLEWKINSSMSLQQFLLGNCNFRISVICKTSSWSQLTFSIYCLWSLYFLKGHWQGF